MKLFNRNYLMVLIGQIISLFGNSIIRFALPLYLLQTTGSASLFGVVTAITFIPTILLMPIGGIIADRVNKRNVMVALDFGTAAILLGFIVSLGRVNLITSLLVVMILLSGIQSAYSPAVQASIPLFVGKDDLVRANSLINMVSSLSSLLGPAIGGVLFSFWGINTMIYIGITCFIISATMEIFIVIPYKKQKHEDSVVRMAAADLKSSFLYVVKEQNIILKVTLISTLINLVASACFIIGLPVIVTNYLGFKAQEAGMMYGYVDAVFGAGSLAGGFLASIYGGKIKMDRLHYYLIAASVPFFPIAIVLSTAAPSMVKYITIMVSTFVMMLFSTMFSIRIMSELQMMTPEHMLGKVIGCVYCLCMCAIPLGQAIYGVLFQNFGSSHYLIIGVSGVIMCIISVVSGIVFKSMKDWEINGQVAAQY